MTRQPTALLAALGLLAGCATASADSLDPVSLSVSAPSVASRHAALRATVGVTADPGVLDVRAAPLRIRAKLAPECGGSFTGTTGPTVIDAALSPQPAAGKAYTATVTGKRKPAAYGTFTLCVFLEEEGDNRQFATDTDSTVAVTHTCTSASDRYATLKRRLATARKHRSRSVASLRRRAVRAQRTARAKCS